MTREELKDIVRRVFYFYDANAEDSNWTDMNEACGEIIKAIEQESCEDAVSRSQVVEWLQRASDDSIQHAIDSNLEFIPSVIPKLPECKDTVSRSEVNMLCARYLKEATDDHVAFYEHFCDLPSVMPTRKKGRWIYTPQKRLVDETAEGPVYEVQEKCNCSACGADFGYRKVDDNYCKYCGCQMGGE